MDTNHLNPRAIPPHFDMSLAGAPRGSLSISPETRESHEPRIHVSVEKRPEPQRDAQRPEGFAGSAIMSDMGYRPRKPRKTLVLCFDGTGNQFHGDSSDSNILKIFRMLDRNSGKGFHYYQPGIGTYVASGSLSTTGSLEKLKNWYLKAKDSAVGTSFDQHVVGGYKFLMQFYSPGDNIYMFGFSRGSYTVRFLAEMIDWVGLITHGNEEMIQFAWHTFSKWKAIDRSNREARQQEKKAYDFMVSFRETFSRPVRRIRFLGLFDTVNSVPRFENAILSRKRIPFSAISSAKIIRHAVSIDERRAKFRADLCSHGMAARKDIAGPGGDVPPEEHHHHIADWVHHNSRYKATTKKKLPTKGTNGLVPKSAEERDTRGRSDGHLIERSASRYRSHSRAQSHQTGDPRNSISAIDFHGAMGSHGGGRRISIDNASIAPSQQAWDDDDNDSSDGDEDDQDIEELWFPGGHADIGGGWECEEGETPLSHVPLVWIVREAQRAGLEFDEEKMAKLGCIDDNMTATETEGVPTIALSASPGQMNGGSTDQLATESKVKKLLVETASKGKLHDCLRIGQGLPVGSVLRWRLMEWMPFRRLDLSEDGKWKPIRWPLPRGEVRDMPADAKVHKSAIIRLEQCPDYRPGNLILGGWGRGVIRAPASAGIGEWNVAANEGDIVAECVVRTQRFAPSKTGRPADSSGVSPMTTIQGKKVLNGAMSKM